MTDYVQTIGGSGGLVANSAGGAHRLRVDLAVMAALCSVASFTSGDTLTVLAPPAGTLIRSMTARVLKVEGATLNVDIGDADDPDGYHDALDLNVLGFSRGVNSLTTGTPNTLTGYTGGKFYAATGAIKILFNQSSANVAIFDLFVHFDTAANSPDLPTS